MTANDYFSPELSSQYDRKIRASIPGYEALHAMTHDFLGLALPETANILVVGAGTGMELVTLGLAHPHWLFTAVDLSKDMIAICRNAVSAEGLNDRVRIHHGKTDELPQNEFYDAATSILVSHFILSREEKTAHFEAISALLRPAAPLITADLVAKTGNPHFEYFIKVWLTHKVNSGMSKKEVEDDFERSRKAVSFIPEDEYCDILKKTGFADIHQFYRALLFCGWICKKSC